MRYLDEYRDAELRNELSRRERQKATSKRTKKTQSPSHTLGDYVSLMIIITFFIVRALIK